MAGLFDLPGGYVPSVEFNRLKFGCYTVNEVEKLSVVEVTQTKTFDAVSLFNSSF